MKIKTILITVLLFSMLLVGLTSSVPYDPWCDLDDDGDIDIFDIVKMAGAYGTTGTPINKTELLLDLQSRVASLEELVALLASGTCVVEGNKLDGDVQADMVETDPGGVATIDFENPFITVDPPEMFVTVVLKQAGNGLVEGAAVKAFEDVKGSAGNWTGFDITVTKQSGGSLIDGTKVFVTWIAIGTESPSTQPKHCAETAVPYTTQLWTPPPPSLNSNQIKVDFPVTFTNASYVELSASGIGVTGSCAGSPLRITAVNMTATYAILTLQGWNGSAWTNLDAGDEVEISYVATEKLSS